MNEARRDSLVRAFVAGAASLCVFAAAARGASPRPVGERGGECWVLLDLDAFSCGLCLESLLAFCRAIPAGLQETRVRGVLLLRPPSPNVSDASLVGIALRKWEGFRRANDIRFPVYCDQDRAIRGPGKAGVAVMLLDGPGRSLRTLPFPLKPKQLAEVLRFLGQ
jgi:hypothetical protein